ncbi:unnamed protein product [Closterium sp. NIES-64]|nr:unnamed protein product [Closterium sp. NIES-64]
MRRGVVSALSFTRQPDLPPPRPHHLPPTVAAAGGERQGSGWCSAGGVLCWRGSLLVLVPGAGAGAGSCGSAGSFTGGLAGRGRSVACSGEAAASPATPAMPAIPSTPSTPAIPATPFTAATKSSGGQAGTEWDGTECGLAVPWERRGRVKGGAGVPHGGHPFHTTSPPTAGVAEGKATGKRREAARGGTAAAVAEYAAATVA